MNEYENKWMNEKKGRAAKTVFDDIKYDSLDKLVLISFVALPIMLSVDDLHSKILDTPRSKILFHAVFGKIWQNCMLAPLAGGFAPPPGGNSGSATDYYFSGDCYGREVIRSLFSDNLSLQPFLGQLNCLRYVWYLFMASLSNDNYLLVDEKFRYQFFPISSSHTNLFFLFTLTVLLTVPCPFNLSCFGANLKPTNITARQIE